MDGKLILLNHSSLLISHQGRYLLTDPWHLKPAFGSWMPTFQQYIHPSYLSALGTNLAIIISHGHDDHCDDNLLKIFDPSTTFIVPNFRSQSVLKRIRGLGFDNVIPLELGECSSLKVHDSHFRISGFVSPDLSEDDSVITIGTTSGLVIHANDNWAPFSESLIKSISLRINATDTQKGYLFTQANSASGHPLSYRNLRHERKKILRSKVKNMIEGGIKNAQALGLSEVFSYAGYATPYVKDQDYHDVSLVPTPRMIKSDILECSSLGQQYVAEFYPGDVLHLATGKIEKAFVSSDSYTEQQIKTSTMRYYEIYQSFPEYYCRDLDVAAISIEELNWFLAEFGRFVSKKISINKARYSDIIGKTFTLEVEDLSISGTILFGDPARIFLSNNNHRSNKHCYVKHSSILKSIFMGETLFESLYTGYLGEWTRNPEGVYNRDIVMMIVMFSYYYRNIVVQDYMKEFSR